MPRILVAECIPEVCSFNPVPSRSDDCFVRTGEPIRTYPREVRTEVGGALPVLAAPPGWRWCRPTAPVG